MPTDPSERTTSMNVSLPSSLKEFVDEQVTTRGYTSASEFVRELIRGARDRTNSERQLEERLLEGLESGAAEPFEADFFEKLRTRIRRGQGRDAAS